ncbi:MAG TPA: PQQ-binding-like beta-propeller repeat protein [Steroidobacteraceae bacterium]|jgi:PQQ-dependent dehydrogenase (methanol/ethanol family)
MPTRTPSLAALATVSLLLATTTGFAQEDSPGSQWLNYNNRLDGQRFSPLKEINAGNIGQLGEVCRVTVDGPTSYHAGIIVADGVIYTATGRYTYAIDARTCYVKWKYTYQPDEERAGGSNRGVAVMNGMVFRGTSDARLLALDAQTGKLIWKDVVGTGQLGEQASMAPLAWQGVVYMGIAGSEAGIRGRVMAYDARTGKELWRFNTIPMGKETGAETWKKPETAKTGGGGIWGAMSVDPSSNELFVSVGNAWPDINKAYRPGANLFTTSVVVLDARTGALKWWHQTAPEDWQDLDLVAAPVAYRTNNVRDMLVIGGKDGYVTGLDRDTHKVVFRTPVTTIEQVPPKFASTEGHKACPGYAGGVEWNGPALDRPNNSLIVGSVDTCFLVKLDPKDPIPGRGQGGSVEPVGDSTGWVVAMDAATGAVKWKYHAEKPVVAGVTPTAGGITFTGDLAGNLLVFDSKTGSVLRKVKTGGALAGGVVTYEAGGKQYVAFNSGNISRNAFGDVGIPSMVIMTLNPGQAAAPSAPAVRTAGPAAGGGGFNAPSVASGRTLYTQICTSCHGETGDMMDDHKLSTLKQRRDAASTIAYIKDPKAPMPKLYPSLINDQAVADVTAYVRDELAK